MVSQEDSTSASAMQEDSHENPFHAPTLTSRSTSNQCLIYAFGSNGSSQLGISHTNDLSKPSPAALFGSNILPKRILGSGNHSVMLADRPPHGPHMTLVGREPLAEALPCSNYYDSRAQQTQEDQIAQSILGVVGCAVTWDAFAVARPLVPEQPDLGTRIQTFGAGEKGQLGRAELSAGNTDGHTAMVTESEVACMAGGVQHFVAVLKNGQVFGWGNGRKGQLGEPVQAVVERPRLIEKVDFQVVHAVCGQEFTMLLGDPAEGRFAILGSDKWQIKTDAPNNIKGWRQVGAGWGTISVLLDTRRVLSWGRNDRGQRAPQGLPPIFRMAVGSEHTVALSDANEVLVWGWGEHGNCGEDVDERKDVKAGFKRIPMPAEVGNNRLVVDVAAGCATTWFWVSP